jgi:hypothetical protein
VFGKAGNVYEWIVFLWFSGLLCVLSGTMVAIGIDGAFCVGMIWLLVSARSWKVIEHEAVALSF